MRCVRPHGRPRIGSLPIGEAHGEAHVCVRASAQGEKFERETHVGHGPPWSPLVPSKAGSRSVLMACLHACLAPVCVCMRACTLGLCARRCAHVNAHENRARMNS